MSNWFSWLKREQRKVDEEMVPDPWLPLVEVMQELAAKEQKESDQWRQKFLRMRQKRNNKRQTLAALRLRHQELAEDYDAMRQERDSLRDAWEDISIELEQLKQKVYQEEEE